MSILIEHLPMHYQESSYVTEIQNAFEVALVAAQNEKDVFLEQLNVDTATWSLSLWEDMCGLVTDETKSDAMRRERIKSKLRGFGTTTLSMLENAARAFSNGDITITEYPAESRFEIAFTGTIGRPPDLNDFCASLDEIIPAHLTYSIIIRYAANQELKPYTHAQLAAFMHTQIRNGDIIDG